MKRRLVQFLKGSSVKGVPRIFRTKSHFLRTLWIISVISFLSIASHQAYLLTADYVEHTTIVSIKEHHVDLTGATPEAVRLPDITFCNMNPFGVDTENFSDIPSLYSYHQRVLEVTECDGCSLEKRKSLWELRVALQTTRGYYIHVGKINAQRLSHTKDQFLASCTVEMLSGMDPRKLPCEHIAIFDYYFDFMYYNCYTLRIPMATSTDLYSGVLVVLHLNNYQNVIKQQQYLNSRYMPGQMSGAVMVFHHQNQIPVLIKDSINLPSGFYMSTKLRFIRRKRLPPPYGSCKHVNEMDGGYKQLACYSDCLQKQVFLECGCVDFTSYNNRAFEFAAFVGFPACLSVKRSKEWLYEKWICVKRTHVNYTTHCLFSCPSLCEELMYNHDVSNLRLA